MAGDEILKNTFANDAFPCLIGMPKAKPRSPKKKLSQRGGSTKGCPTAHRRPAGDNQKTEKEDAVEHSEIAAYKSLLTLCGPAGAENARGLLEQSLKEEEAMAAWVDENIAQDHIGISQQGRTGRRLTRRFLT